MPGIDDLLGASGVIEQFFLWNVVSQAVTTMMSPAFNALQQNTLRAHPNMVITPDILARAVVQTFMPQDEAIAEAAKSGIDQTRLDVLIKLADYRLQPSDLATAVLRSYLEQETAESEARLQGVTPDRFQTLTLLAGDGIGPQQAAEALRRHIIDRSGMGPDSISFDQAIAESRLHNKWGQVLADLEIALLSPPDAADAVVRGFLGYAQGAALASLSGVEDSTFSTMVNLAQDAPSPTELAEALRRQIIPRDSGDPDAPGFVQGIEQGRLGNKWIDMIERLSQLWPTPVDALEARLVGQVSTEQSQQLYAKFGGDPQFWQLLFDTRGESPTPLELIDMANRGIITWSGTGSDKVTYEQGFNEGRWRDKWREPYKRLAVYLPPQSTIVTLLSHGVLSDTAASDLLAKQGMDTELIKAYISQAHQEALSGYRGETVTMILQAYYQQLITAEQATPILEALHVTPSAVKLMLEFEDMQRGFAAINNAMARIRSLYAARKITAKTAKDSLTTLGIKPDTVHDILDAWAIENSISVKTLTEAQIADAYAADLLTYAEALVELSNIGYTPFDAWVILSIKMKAPQPDKPPQGPAAPQDTVVPGTT